MIIIRKYNLFENISLMNQVEPSTPILIYFNIRGKVQSIRYLLFYMNIKFLQINPEDQQQKKKIPQNIVNLLKKQRVELSQMPILVHQELIVNEIYPIMAYLCRRYNRVELLGRDIQDKARLQEILQISLAKHCPCVSSIFKFSQNIEHLNIVDTLTQKSRFFQSLCKEFPHLVEISRYLDQINEGKSFLLKEITIADFCLIQSFVYLVGFFGDLQKTCPIGNAFYSFFGIKKDEKFPQFPLRIMKDYVNFMTNQPFYTYNKDYLQKFSIRCGKFSDAKKKGVQKLWTLDKKFVR